jgi:ABC-type cobalamin/Fe3+-siderophores transport system ATPase subunit
LHDPTLAARYADEVLLLFRSGDWCFGACEAMLTAATLSELYGTTLRRLVYEGRTLFFQA